MEAVVKHSTADVLFSDVLFPDWIEVTSDLSGCSNHQYKQCYSLDDTVVKLTFVFLCVTFRDSPFLGSSHVLTKDTDSVDSEQPIHGHRFPVTPFLAHTCTQVYRNSQPYLTDVDQLRA